MTTSSTMTRSAVDYVLGVLGLWAEEPSAVATPAPTGVAVEAVDQVVRANRLEPLFGLRLDGRGLDDGWQAMLQTCTEAYRQNLLRGLRGLAAGKAIADALAVEGIDCVASRGPFAGVELYGDAGARHFTDLDILVPQTRAEAALQVARRLGYRMRNPLIPEWFFRRHHLHWSLQHAEQGIICDLHWAVDHPYKLQAIDYAGIFARARRWEAEPGTGLRPSPEDRLLLACAHVDKECRLDRYAVAGDDFVVMAASEGRLLKWLDLSLLLRRSQPSVDPRVFMQRAREWGIESAVATSLTGLGRLWPGAPTIATESDAAVASRSSATGTPAPRIAGLGPTLAPARPRWLERACERAGFRSQCLADAWTYLVPPRTHFRSKSGAGLAAQRIGHSLRAAGRLARAGVDAGVCSLIVSARRRLVSAIVAASLVGGAAMSRADDFGNDPQSAAALIPNAPATAVVIETDTDEDWFSFQALPGVSYTLVVTNGTVWDTSIELYAPSGVADLGATNTVVHPWTNGTTASLPWTHDGAAATFYLRAYGFVEFTTGSCDVAVASDFADSDSDGLHDPWETTHFGSLTNGAGGDFDGDGLSNIQEYHLNSVPIESSSGLLVTNIVHEATDSLVTWQAAKYGAYRLQTSTNLLVPAGWTNLGTMLIEADPTAAVFRDVGGATSPARFYRVQFLYE